MVTNFQRRKHDYDLEVDKARKFWLEAAEVQIDLYLHMGRELVLSDHVQVAKELCYMPIRKITRNLQRALSRI